MEEKEHTWVVKGCAYECNECGMRKFLWDYKSPCVCPECGGTGYTTGVVGQVTFKSPCPCWWDEDTDEYLDFKSGHNL